MKNVKIENKNLLEQAYNNPFNTIEEKRPAYKISIYYNENFDTFECKISSMVFSSTISIYSESDQKYLDKLCELADTYINDLYE